MRRKDWSVRRFLSFVATVMAALGFSKTLDVPLVPTQRPPPALSPKAPGKQNGPVDSVGASDDGDLDDDETTPSVRLRLREAIRLLLGLR